MRYSGEEKQIATDFIVCKIPESIRNNDYNLKYDSMELYEALFDMAHCILNDMSLASIFINSLNDEDWQQLLCAIGKNFAEQNFVDKSNRLYTIAKKYL